MVSKCFLIVFVPFRSLVNGKNVLLVRALYSKHAAASLRQANLLHVTIARGKRVAVYTIIVFVLYHENDNREQIWCGCNLVSSYLRYNKSTLCYINRPIPLSGFVKRATLVSNR